MNKTLLVIMVILSAFIVGCTVEVVPDGTVTNNPSVTLASDSEIHTFGSEAELIALLESSSNNNYYGGIGLGGAVVRTMAMEDSVVMESAAVDSSADKSSGSTDFSETNVQVQGVDEGDIIKTDGEFIYTATGSTLFIVKAGSDAKVINTVEFDDHITGLFINDDKIIVFRNAYGISELSAFRSSFTKVEIYDMSDRTELEILEELIFEGYTQETRMKGDMVYVVTQSSSYLDDGYPWPILYRDNEIMPIAIDRISYIGIPYRNAGFVNVHEISLADSYAVETTSLVVDNGFELYMSHQNIYIATPQYVNEWELELAIVQDELDQYLTEADLSKIAKINAVDSDVLTLGEKESKVNQVYERRAVQLSEDEQEQIAETAEKKLAAKIAEIEYMQTTVIQRISLNGLSVEATGSIAGSLNNQFSMDERDDVLRVATTVPQRWSRYTEERTESDNHIYTLDGDLNELDSVTGIAKGESIFATRFIDERLYMVTFRQVDPFFVVDLSDANNIDVVGELKIPGFSRYLHPYDENVIIGIGQDADPKTGRATGLKISLFDVSDVTNPKEIASYVGDDTYAGSTALYEHKAFLFDKEKNLLVLPVYNYDYRDESDSYNGAFVFNVYSGSIELRGLISHETGGQYWSGSVERSLYIDNLLYTKSPTLIRVNDLGDLGSVANVTLNSEKDFIVY